MSRIRQFLTPGWVLTAVVCIAFAYVAFTVLAPWQLGKNAATKERNKQLTHAFEVDPVDASEVFPAGGELREGDEWRRVTAQGEYLPDSDVLLRNRPVDGTPATQALTAFRADDGTVYLVNRGFETPPDGGVPEIEKAPSGTVTILGYARRGEIAPERPPLEGTGGEPTQVYGINIDQVGGIMGEDLHPDYIQLAPDQPGVLNPIPLPKLESGPYLSYGIQWIFFGIMAPAALVWFIVAEIRERRRDREEQEALLSESATKETEPTVNDAGAGDAAAGAPDADGSDANGSDADGANADTRTPDADAAAAAAAEERARRLATRYGDSGHSGRRKKKNRGIDGERF